MNDDIVEIVRPERAVRATRLVVRPEHATLTKPAQGQLKGAINNVVYFGTDTHFHVKLNDGTDFMVRQQNSGASAQDYQKGAKVGIQIADNTLRILKD